MPGPSPYDLYIDFRDLAALWARASDQPAELTYRCALQAVEMGLALLADAAADARPAARREERVQALADNLVGQVALARQLFAGTSLPPRLLVAEPADSPGVRSLRVLGPQFPTPVAAVVDAVLRAPFPVPLGIEPDLATLRAGADGPPRRAPEGPFLPYQAWVRPERVAELVLREPYGPEDRLFAGVHQITECWLRLVLERFLEAEQLARGSRDWNGAAARLEAACAILAFLGQHIELLHLMVIADYHPMRVALRGASGAQSAAARAATASARHLLPPLLGHLEARQLTALDVLRAPHEHPAEHRYLEAAGAVERRLLQFYFLHFQLARKVLGTKALGSLGYEVRALAERFLATMLPELDEARYDHTMLTNLAHGNDAGRIIADREGHRPAIPAPPRVRVDATWVRATVARYFEAVRALDLEAWLATLHPEATLEDPVGSRPHRGAAELRVFFQGVQRTFTRLNVQEGPLRVEGARATAAWQARATTYNGHDVAFEGTEIFDLGPDGLIRAVRVLWDPRTVADQMTAPSPATA